MGGIGAVLGLHGGISNRWNGQMLSPRLQMLLATTTGDYRGESGSN
jgi:hypothetical protein